jgi:hypothetical protein
VDFGDIRRQLCFYPSVFGTLRFSTTRGIKPAVIGYSIRRSLLTRRDQKAGSEMEFWIVLVLVSLVSTLLMGLLVSCLDTEKLAFLENLALKKRITIFQTSDPPANLEEL